MPRPRSPHAGASVPVEAVGNGTASNTSNRNGSGGGASSSCSSDDDDGGECSRDSFRSEMHSSPEDACNAASSPVPLNGIEVKPCRSLDSLSSSSAESGANGIAVRPQRPSKRLLDAKDLTSPPSISDTDFGGRLRFYLDGNCVLELRHDLDDEGRPKQWVQSWGKTYHPPPPSSLPLPPPAWHPKELSSQDSQGRKFSPLPAVIPSPLKNRKKLVNGQHLATLVLRRRNMSSHPLIKSTILPTCILRRAARSPGRVINSDGSCSLGSRHHTCRKMPVRISHPCTSFQKSQNITAISEELARKHDSLEPESKTSSNNVSGESPLHMKVELTHSSQGQAGQETLIDVNAANHACHPVSGDSEEDIDKRPLPEWYFDPTKASIPVTEMIGYPRPSLLAPPKLLSPKKRDAEELVDFMSESPKRIKDCQDSSTDVRFHGRLLPSSQVDITCCATSPCGVVDKKETCLSLAKETAQDDLVLPSEDLSPVKQRHSLGAICKVPHRESDGIQRKKKKGGYGRGRTIGEAVRAFVIGDILNLGGDVRTKYVPRGVFTEVASRYKIDATTTYRWWLKYCTGIRMASNGISSPPNSSQKPFLLPNLTAGPSNVHTLPEESKSSVNKVYDKLDKPCQNVIQQSPAKKDWSSIVNLVTENLSTKEYSRVSHGGSLSPRSDDSASSGASLVDPTSLYVSSMAFVPPSGAWPQSMLPVHRLPLPVGICMPYLWNYSTMPPCSNGVPNNLPSVNDNEKADVHHQSSDEPLDLTLPKKKIRSDDHGSPHFIVQSAKEEDNRHLKSPYMYSECEPDKLILKQLLSIHQHQVSAVSTDLVQTGKRCRTSKLITKGIGPHPTFAQHNMKPKHYPFLSLQIGTFEIHSTLSVNRKCDKEFFKENPNKFKVIFTQRKFVYEFETDSCIELPPNGHQKKSTHSQKMACIVVPFSIVEAFWCCGATIILRVLSKPFMFLGQRLKQAGCVPSLTVYETKNSVDLTGGQLSVAHLHKVTLLKPRLVEQLKIYLVLFDVRFQNLMPHSILSILNQPGETILQVPNRSDEQKA